MKFTPLHSERLLLRPLTDDDAEDLALRRSDPTTAEFQSWTVPFTVERARELIAKANQHGGPVEGAWYQAAVEQKKTGKVLGDVAMFVEEGGRNALIGYTLHVWARGHWYATEAAGRLVEYLVEDVGVHRVEASTDPGNLASSRVLERLGFTLEGVKRESFWIDGRFADDAIWGLLAVEWRERRGPATQRDPSVSKS